MMQRIAQPAGRKAAMPFIMAAVPIDMVPIGLIIPVLAPLIGTFTNSQSEQAIRYGVITIAFGVANFSGSPILGRLSDRDGRRPVLLIGCNGLALSFFVTGMATALWMMLVVRMSSGAIQSNIAVANAYVADITPPEHRARAFGQLGAMPGMGLILGPVIGGLLGGISLHLPFFVAGVLACVNWLYGYFALPESLSVERRQPFVLREANPVDSLRGLTELKGVGSLVVVISLSGLAQFMAHTTWVLYTTLKLGWAPTQNGWSLFAIGGDVGAGAGRIPGPAAEALHAAAAGDHGAGVVEPLLRALGPCDRRLNALRRDLRERTGLCRLGLDPESDPERRRSDHAGPHLCRGRVAQQHDGRTRAGDRRAFVRDRVAPAPRRLAHRRTLIFLRFAAGRFGGDRAGPFKQARLTRETLAASTVPTI